MKTMCPPGYHHNGFVATHALGHMMRAHLASVRFEHSVCRGSLMLFCKKADLMPID